MMTKVSLGDVYIPDEIVDAINKHRESMINACTDEIMLAKLENASFSTFFSDYMFKFGYMLLK